MLITSCFVTLNLGRKKSTGTEPQSGVISIKKISAVNITLTVPALSDQYNVTQYLARLYICEVKTFQNIL